MRPPAPSLEAPGNRSRKKPNQALYAASERVDRIWLRVPIM